MKKYAMLFPFLLFVSMMCHAQTMKYLGLTTGQTKAQTSRQLSRLGFSSLICKKIDFLHTQECTSSRSEQSTTRRIVVSFTKGLFTSLVFEFPSSAWNTLYSEIQAENGSPTKPHEILGRGSAVSWNDRDECPCESISLVKDSSRNTFMWVNAPLSITLARSDL